MNLVLAPEAKQDLDEIFDYILERSPQAAHTTLERVEEALRSLAQMPHQGRPGRIPRTRELVISGTPFIVPYQVAGRTVEILRIYHGAR